MKEEELRKFKKEYEDGTAYNLIVEAVVEGKWVEMSFMYNQTVSLNCNHFKINEIDKVIDFLKEVKNLTKKL